MKKIFALDIPSRRAIGIRLEEERRVIKGGKVGAEDTVDFRAKVVEIKPDSAGFGKVEIGDILFEVGYKNDYMKSWQWELVLGYSLEDVVAGVAEAKQSEGRILLRFFRPERSPNDDWISTPSSELVENLNSLPREKNIERKRGDVESSSVRVGPEYQCTSIPPYQGKYSKQRGKGAGTGNDGSTAAFLVSRAMTTAISGWLDSLAAKHDKNLHILELALSALHECNYSLDRAKAKFDQESKNWKCVIEWTPEMVEAFTRALDIVRARDFVSVRKEMAAEGIHLKTGDIVQYYYSHFKSSEGYRKWCDQIKPEELDTRPFVCIKCEEDDPVGQSVKCVKCAVRFKHWECFNPPLLKEMLSDVRVRRWICDECAKPQGISKKTVGIRALSSLGADSTSFGSSTRRAAQAASSKFSTYGDQPGPRAKRGSGANRNNEEYSSDEEHPRKRARAGIYDDEGRRMHTLKGVPINANELIEHVNSRGGYEAVMEKKLWQAIRKEMNLPHTTSSSFQLREAYLGYVKMDKGEAASGKSG